MEQEKIVEAIKGKVFVRDGKEKLACQSALKLAEELGMDPKEIRQICDDNGIRVANCQLGCFD